MTDLELPNELAIATEHVLDKGEVSLLGYMGDDKLIADTARISYRKGTKQSSNLKQLLRYLIRNRHTSPFEHACMRFYIKAPLFVIQQLLRHRTFKFNQASARYSEMLNEAYLPLPEHITGQDAKNRQARTDTKIQHWDTVHRRMKHDQANEFNSYQFYLEQGVAREIARINVPHGTYSELIVTADVHNLMHFLALRCHSHAQYEIRVYADAMRTMLKGLFPLTSEAWEDCVFNAFTLTGSMQVVLGDAIQAFSNDRSTVSGEKDRELPWVSWPETVAATADRYEWVSKSEKDQFITWCVTRLKVT